MFGKIDADRAKWHPLDAVLTGGGLLSPGNINWNFGKFLIGGDGTVVERSTRARNPIRLK